MTIASCRWTSNRRAPVIERFTGSSKLGDYLNGEMVKVAVERKFETISVVLKRHRSYHPELVGRISRLLSTMDFRKILSHVCDRMGARRVWTYAKSDLSWLAEVTGAPLVAVKVSRE